MVAWLIRTLRILVGLLTIKVGTDLAQGNYAFSGYGDSEPFF